MVKTGLALHRHLPFTRAAGVFVAVDALRGGWIVLAPEVDLTLGPLPGTQQGRRLPDVFLSAGLLGADVRVCQPSGQLQQEVHASLVPAGAGFVQHVRVERRHVDHVEEDGDGPSPRCRAHAVLPHRRLRSLGARLGGAVEVDGVWLPFVGLLRLHRAVHGAEDADAPLAVGRVDRQRGFSG